MGNVNTYITGLLISIVFSILILIYSLKNIRVKGAKYIVLLSFVVFIWSGGYIFEIMSPTLEGKLFWDNIQMLGGALGVSCVLFAVDFTEIKNKYIDKIKILIIIEPITIWFLANVIGHQGFRTDPKLIISENISAVVYGFGYLSAIDFIYGYIMYFIFIFLLIRYMRRSSKLYVSQITFVLMGMTIVVVGFTLMFLGFGPIYFRDPTPMTFTILNLSLAYSVFGKKLLEIIPIARHMLFETLDEGILVIDKNSNILDGNKYFKDLFDIDDIYSIDFKSFMDSLGFGVGDVGKSILNSQDKIIVFRTVELSGKRGFVGYMLIFSDVSYEMKLRKTLEISEENYRNIAENSNDGIVIIRDGDIRYINNKVGEILKYDKGHILSSQFINFVKEDQIEKVQEKYDNKSEKKILATRYTTILVDSQGKYIDVEINSTVTTYYGQKAILVYIRDITEIKKQSDIIENLAKNDSLTGIYNRGFFFNRVREILKDINSSYWIGMIDIDYFKSINDRYGHIVGDEVLSNFASFIQDQLEDDIIFGRFGGEEFSIFTTTDICNMPYEFLDKLRVSVMEKSFNTSKGPVKITISIGYSIEKNVDDVLEDVLKRADAALYQAKKTGRNKTDGSLG